MEFYVLTISAWNVSFKMTFQIRYYDKLVPDAYHGTTHDSARQIIAKQEFIPSAGEDEYLGFGVYFFEGSELDAKEWARKRVGRRGKIAVIQAVVNLGRCLDLNVREHRKFVQDTVRHLGTKRRVPGVTDAMVINFIGANFKPEIDTVRALYPPRDPGNTRLFPGSRLWDFVRLVICVRNVRNIIKFSKCYEELL